MKKYLLWIIVGISFIGMIAYLCTEIEILKNKIGTLETEKVILNGKTDILDEDNKELHRQINNFSLNNEGELKKEFLNLVEQEFINQVNDNRFTEASSCSSIYNEVHVYLEALNTLAGNDYEDLFFENLKKWNSSQNQQKLFEKIELCWISSF
ncbi:hypothetical protein HYV70_02420 [Candidatus Uhrbacteria bacterium]|nr:hypothetical protein [Candidatus Uhrbacteria bacterium]